MHDSKNNLQNAIRVRATDFLIKPINILELKNSIKSVIVNIENKTKLVNALKSNNFKESSYQDTLIRLSGRTETIFVPIKNILYCQSSNVITIFNIIDGGKSFQFLSSNSIGEWMKIFQDPPMVRVHREFIVNFEHISGFKKGANFMIFTFNGIKIPVSRANKEKVISLLQKLNI